MDMNYTTQNIAQAITDKIIAELEQHQKDGTLPSWVKGWKSNGAEGRPYNPVTKNYYQGINWLWLSCLQHSGDFGSSNEWFTYKQAQTITGLDYPVKKGSKSVQVIFYKTLEIEDKNAPKNEDGSSPLARIPMMKIYRVFNRDCIEGLETPTEPTENVLSEDERLQDFENFIYKTRASIQWGGSRAYYQPELDYIQVPKFEDFNSVGEYYSTLTHELTHWTGHANRLDRLKNDRFGSESYAFEELVAELGSAMMNSKLKLTGKLQHTEYIGSWLKVLKNDNKAILKASALAQKAFEYLSNLTEGDKAKDTATATA